MRPKIETYDKDVQLIILRTARYDDDAEQVEFGEISVFLSPTFVIAVRQGVASELRDARQRLEQRPELLAAGSSSALWAIMDQVVDGYAPVVAGLEHDIDQIEATVFSGSVAPTERIYSLRNEATDFYRAVHPLLAVTAIAERAAQKKLRPYFRDVRDHLLRVDEEITDQRDVLTTALDKPLEHGGGTLNILRNGVQYIGGGRLKMAQFRPETSLNATTRVSVFARGVTVRVSMIRKRGERSSSLMNFVRLG